MPTNMHISFHQALHAMICVAMALMPAVTCFAAGGPATSQAAEPLNLTGQSRAPENPLSLWYRKPATRFEEALPLGNGQLGAMLYGTVETEQLGLNKDTLWAGGPYDPVNPAAKEALPEVRKLIFAGQYHDAATLLSEKVMAMPLKQMPYETVGDLLLRISGEGDVADYRRDLNLDSALATVSYTRNGIRF